MNRPLLYLFSALLLTIMIVGSATAQRVSVAFYNVENLFDTVPSKFGGDIDYTPSGVKGWNTQKYRAKLEAVARVVDSLGADVLGLCEVENEDVVRDLVLLLKTDYCYIHRTTSDSRGLDMALLYKADMFVPDHTSQMNAAGREPLVVSGELVGQPVTMVVCHQPSYFNSRKYRTAALDQLVARCEALRQKGERIILMGDFNFDTSAESMRRKSSSSDAQMQLVGHYENPIGQRNGSKGSYNYDGRWMLYDNIFLDSQLIYTTFSPLNAGLFLRRFMLSSEGVSKKFYRRRYLSAASDHIPVFVVLECVKK